MSLIKAGTEVPYRVTFLRMTARPDTQTALPQDITLERIMDPPLWYFFALYDAVGRDYEWVDQHNRPEAELRAFLESPLVELWVAKRGGVPQGFFMLDFTDPPICDLAYFGLMPNAVGQGLGRALLNQALAQAWDGAGVTSVTINTCTLDHPRALALYQSAGFVAERFEDRSRILTRDRDTSLHPA